MGRTMDYLDSSLAGNCTDPPRGGEKAYLSPSAEDMMRQIAYQSLDHLKAIQLSLGSNKSCNRPGIDVSCSRFSRIVNDAMGHTLWPDFDWYKNDYTTLLGAYWFSGLLTKCYTGILDRCEGPATNRLCGSLAAAKARQEMVIRTVLYQNFQHNVYPYKISVAEFTNRLSRYKDKLAGSNGTADEGLWVPSCLGTGGSNSNMFSADSYGLPFSYNVTDGCDVVKAVLGPMAYNYK
ncbi:desiccation-related protein PCC13-62 [Selaginella moellendorffii]|nr:desiccation-related protein PCC13-62 [Selaginella moellendorffii]|eukprot:XP_002976149.2 desiccation-related protein PCC13-62 [Selaginella moellendorffii]